MLYCLLSVPRFQQALLRTRQLEDGTLGHKYWTCFEFGRGICTPLHEIFNLDFFAKLIIKLNSTNYAELHNKYWQSVHTV